MTDDNLQQQLTQLGPKWPRDEHFVDSVMARLAEAPCLATNPHRSKSRIIRFSYWIAASIIVCIGLWWTSDLQSSGNVLYAQVMEAMKKVQSLHAVVYMQTEDGIITQVGETWFARNQGFVVMNTEQTRIDNGIYFWEFANGSDTASRTKSQGTDELLDKALDIRKTLERDCERYPAGDRIIDGMGHQCYRLTFHGAVKPADPSLLDFDKRRTLVFINSESLLKRIESQNNVAGEWQTHIIRTWEYDVSVDPKWFEPNFGSDVQVIDTDEAFEQLTAVEGSFHTEQREGLIYTIHQAKRFENGGVFLRTSVRGTDKTLIKYPLTRRRVQPGLYFTDGPATNWDASPQGSGYFRLRLANANQRGVDVEWWIMVPRGRKPDWFVNREGQVQLELGMTPKGEYAKANHADERGVIHHIHWNLALGIPQPDTMPSLSKITRQVHSELQMLSSSAFPHLHMGVKEVNGVPNQQFGSTDKVSPSQFAKATREHWLRWERGDKARGTERTFRQPAQE
ncbi:MAG: hypothetical protein GXP28_10185 [Planctomycetes bacterium]|nr:hypothetical protein [Planctomycetota bacterium]